MSMSSFFATLYVVGWAADTYCIMCKMRFFLLLAVKEREKRTNFPKIRSFAIDSNY